MSSLRRRLILGTTAAASLVLIGSGLLLYQLISTAMWDAFDRSLEAKARSLTAMTEQEDGELEIEIDEVRLVEYEPSESAEYYQVWVGKERSLRRSPSLEAHDLPFLSGELGQAVFMSAPLPDGRPGRLVGLRYVPRPDDEGKASDAEFMEVTLVVGRSTADVKVMLGFIGAAMAGVGALAVLITVVVVAWSVRAGLRPVDDLAAEIERVDADEFNQRVEVEGLPIELAPVMDRLNGMLARLEASFQREKQFTANVAHELRTPLAGLRSMIEVALRQPREAEDYARTLKGAKKIHGQMERMVENLLHLARADASQLCAVTEVVDLSELTRTFWSPFAEDVEQRGISVAWEMSDPCTVTTDPDKLRLVLTNLMSNAAAYTENGGRIAVFAGANGDCVSWVIRNSGCTLAPNDVGRVYDRFWRGDHARGDQGRHCGLGLSLCRALMELMEGDIDVAVTDEGEFIAALRLKSGG